MLAAVKQITYFYSWSDYRLLGYSESPTERIKAEVKLGLRTTEAEEVVTGLERLRR